MARVLIFIFFLCKKRRRMRVRDERKKKWEEGESDGYGEKVGRYISFKICMILT